MVTRTARKSPLNFLCEQLPPMGLLAAQGRGRFCDMRAASSRDRRHRVRRRHARTVRLIVRDVAVSPAGETIRCAADIGWICDLTVRRMMRADLRIGRDPLA